MVEDYTFDNMDRLDVMRHYVSDGNNANLTDNVLKDEFDYGYSNDNQRTTLQEKFLLNGAMKTTNYTWVYDAANRLSSEQIDHWDNNFDQTETYIYDLVGNRLQKSTDKTADTTFKYTYDNNDRLTGETRHPDLTGTATANQTTTYGWTGTQQTSKAVTTGTTTVTQSMVFGLTGQLAQVTTETSTSGTVNSRTRVEYRYDNSGIRFIAIDTTDSIPSTPAFDTAANGRTEYLIDHNNFTGYGQTLIETKYNGTGNLIERTSYTFGTDEITQTVSTYHPTTGVLQTTATHVYSHDGHGSVRAIYAASAAFAQVFTYTAYGELLAIHNATAGFVSSDAAAALTKLLYNGEGIDTRTGLYNFRARWYSASNARFERLDPYGGDSNDPFSYNKYAFAHGNPVYGTDPSGLFTIGGALSAIGISAGFGALFNGGYAAAKANAAGLQGAEFWKSVMYGAGEGALFGAAIGATFYFGAPTLALMFWKMGAVSASSAYVLAYSSIGIPLSAFGAFSGASQIADGIENDDPVDVTFGSLTFLLSITGLVASSRSGYLAYNQPRGARRTPTLVRGENFDYLETYTFTDARGLKWDLGMKSQVKNDRLVVYEAHIGPQNTNGTAAAYDAAIGKLDMQGLILQLASYFKVKTIDVPQKLQRLGTAGRKADQGFERSKYTFGPLTVKIDDASNIKFSRYRAEE